MSTRVLKKLGLEGDTGIPEFEEDSNEEFLCYTYSRSKFNRYDLLNYDTHSESEVKEHDGNETTESMNVSDNVRECKDTKERKKKKKKRRKNKFCHTARCSEDNIDDEFERSIREIDQLFGSTSIHCAKAVNSTEIGLGLCSEMVLLKVEPRHLNPNNEFKRMFGSKMINKRAEFKRNKTRSRSIRNTIIVLPKETWLPSVKQGISMTLIEKKNNCSFFTFEHSHSYQEIQRDFLAAVSALTPDDIIAIINDYPYHVDALIQLSEVCKIGEDHAMAAEIIERAIYALETAFHPSFNVCRGDCRVNYVRQENRSFYVALMKHIQFVGQRACYRTALELCKMLLCLNPIEDPLALVLVMDYYALRSKEYKWFIDFTNAWDPTRNLLKLPNFKYSLAIAYLRMNNMEKADICLQDALIYFPTFLMQLAKKCGILLDMKVQSHSFFTSLAESSETKPLKCLITLYIERCHQMWKKAEVLPWLEKNVNHVLARVDAQCVEVTEAQTKRMTWFKPTLPVNIKRHLVICDLTEILLLSGERLPHAILHFDPYPPTNSINLYSIPRRLVINNTPGGGILASFFRTLNPNVHYDGPDEQELDELADEIGEVSQDLRRSLRNIVNSVRGLLSNFESETRENSNESTTNTEVGDDLEDTGSSAVDGNNS